MNVLSLFDGMSCGRIALGRAGIPVSMYISSEVDKYAIQVADKNHPQDSYMRMGDVCGVNTEHLPTIDLLIGGRPCQSFSFAGKRKGMSTKCDLEILSLEHYLQLKNEGFEFQGQSYLFWEFMRLLKETGAKYFLLENVLMSKKWETILTEAIGVEPIMINSSLVSAQNRKRLYWTNIPGVEQPEDVGTLLEDILLHGESKCGAIRGRYLIDGVRQDGKMKTAGLTKQMLEPRADNKSNCLTTVQKDNVVLRPCESREFNADALCTNVANATDIKGNDSIKRVYGGGGKAPTITTMQGGHQEPKVLIEDYALSDKANDRAVNNPRSRAFSPGQEKSGALLANQHKQSSDGLYALMPGSELKYRKLTPLECERLQTVPDGYTDHVSNSQRYKMLGNGWTVDVIAHIFKGPPCS